MALQATCVVVGYRTKMILPSLLVSSLSPDREVDEGLCSDLCVGSGPALVEWLRSP